MWIKEFEIQAFGGVRSLNLEFKDGLNVILGNNETGKTSFFKAISHTFFTRTSLNKTESQNIKDIIPIGSDFAKICCLLTDMKNQISIEKQWGSNPFSLIKDSNNNTITDDKNVHEILNNLFPSGPTGFKNIFICPQGEIEKTIENLKTENEPIRNLKDILRQGFLNADGIPIGKFLNVIRKEHQNLFHKWDIDKCTPKTKMSGGNQRWKVKDGNLLTTYYDYLDAKETTKTGKNLEKDLEKTTINISQIKEHIRKLELEYKTSKIISSELKIFAPLKAELDTFDLKLKDLKKAFQCWIKDEANKEQLEKELPEINEDIKLIESKEQKALQQHQGSNGTNTIVLKAKSPTKLSYHLKLQNKSNPINLNTDQIHIIKEAGGISLSTNDLDIEINQIDNSESNHSLLKTLLKNKQALYSKKITLETKLNVLKNEIKNFNQKYNNKDQLLDMIGNLKSKQQNISSKINTFIEKYPDINISQFDSQLDALQDLLTNKKEILHNLQIEEATLKSKSSDIASRDLIRILEEKESEYLKSKKRAYSLDKILKQSEKILLDFEENILKQFEGELENTFKTLTDNKYKTFKRNNNLPENFINNDLEIPFEYLSKGTKASIALALRFSMIKVLAQNQKTFVLLDDPFVDLDPNRFALANRQLHQFLNDNQNIQIILFTCHPHQAEQLEGNTIKL